jgi:type I restriction enzyme, S subunit
LAGKLRGEELRRIALPDSTRKKYALVPGDLLAIRVNGSPALAGSVLTYSGPRDFIFCDHFIRFRLFDGMVPEYLTHAFRHSLVRKQVEAEMVSSAGQHTVSQRTYARIRVPLAPLPEQRRIVAEIEKQFTRLDAAVATLKRVQANLERARASVLKAAVEGRLVPTEAELARAEGRVYEPASVLLERILEERKRKHDEGQADAKRRAKYKPPVAPDVEGLPELPEGWTWASVDQVSWTIRYGTSAKCSSEDLGVPVLRMGNIVEGRLIYEALKYLPADHDEFPAQLLEPGELLFNRTNSVELVGKTAVFKGYPRPVACASYIIRVSLLTGMHPDFLTYCINSPHGRTWIRDVVSQQVGQANVNGTKLRSHVFPLPPWHEQNRIVREVERRVSLNDVLARVVVRNLARCNRLRQSILKRAFEGKLVPQDPNDEPASELLARIQAQTA